jgi:hypothetical protein
MLGGTAARLATVSAARTRPMEWINQSGGDVGLLSTVVDDIGG